MALVLGSVFLVAAPSHAVGESISVVSIDEVGCTDGAYAIGIAVSGLQAGDPYLIRTVVTVNGLTYTNQQNDNIAANPELGWNLYDLFNYGAVLNPGEWPMPSGTEMRVDLTLERPKGTVRAAWTLITAGCDSSTIVSNGKPPDDLDQDGILVPTDKCPSLASPRPNGCPLRNRTLSIAYSTTRHAFVGRLLAKGYAPLHARRPVMVFKVRAGADLKVGQVTTNRRGFYDLHRGKKPGRYYAKSPGLIVASVGEAAADKTRLIRP